jgi:hypothetical protein
MKRRTVFQGLAALTTLATIPGLFIRNVKHFDKYGEGINTDFKIEQYQDGDCVELSCLSNTEMNGTYVIRTKNGNKVLLDDVLYDT